MADYKEDAKNKKAKLNAVLKTEALRKCFLPARSSANISLAFVVKYFQADFSARPLD
jgi:hypothetical protein